MKIFLLATLTLTATLALPRTASSAFITYDLTGTWRGSIKCSALIAGAKQKSVLTPTMRISQIGLNIGVQLDFGTSTSAYGGLANPDAKKPEQKGEAALVLCGTDNVLGVDLFDEIARMAVAAKPGKVKASFKGVSIFSGPSTPQVTHGTCKWKWTRTDTAEPGLKTQCGEPMAQLPPPLAATAGGAR